MQNFPAFMLFVNTKTFNMEHKLDSERTILKIFDVENIVGDVDDQSLREELESCKHFLTDTQMENGRLRVFNFAMSSFDIPLLNDKLDYIFKELKCAAKINLAIGFVLKNIEDGMLRYFYAHENNTIM